MPGKKPPKPPASLPYALTVQGCPYGSEIVATVTPPPPLGLFVRFIALFDAQVLIAPDGTARQPAVWPGRQPTDSGPWQA